MKTTISCSLQRNLESNCLIYIYLNYVINLKPVHSEISVKNWFFFVLRIEIQEKINLLYTEPTF